MQDTQEKPTHKSLLVTHVSYFVLYNIQDKKREGAEHVRQFYP